MGVLFAPLSLAEHATGPCRYDPTVPGGIFCIENWSPDVRSASSIRPLLELLRDGPGGDTRFIHQRVSTPQELRFYLGRFTHLGGYNVGFLALHGAPNRVFVGAEELALEDLLRWTRDFEHPSSLRDDDSDWRLDLSGKVLYLGSCASLRVSTDRLEALRKASNAIAICGYTKPVDWHPAAAFEVLLLSELAHATSGKRQSVRAAFNRVARTGGDLIENLQFVSAPPLRTPG